MHILYRTYSLSLAAWLLGSLAACPASAASHNQSVSFSSYDSCMAAFQSTKALMAQLQGQIVDLERQLTILAPADEKREVPYEALINAPNHQLKSESRREWLVRQLAWRNLRVEDLSMLRGIGIVRITELKEFISGRRRESELYPELIHRISQFFYRERPTTWSNVSPTIWAMRDSQLLPVEPDTVQALKRNSIHKVIDLLKYEEETIERMVKARTEFNVRQIDDLAVIAAMHAKLVRARDAGEFNFSTDSPE